MRSSDPIIALACADIHLSANPPAARRIENDGYGGREDSGWFEAMGRQLHQLRRWSNRFDCPIICAGDVFDRWNSSPALINFAIRRLPKMYAVPGQHDLPYHRADWIHRSAFWTLVESKVIKTIPKDGVLIGRPGRTLRVFGFGWGEEPTVIRRAGPELHIAVVHRYVWSRRENAFPGATEDSHVQNVRSGLQFDVMVFGDNHRGFIDLDRKIANCGTFFRRKSDELSYEPRVVAISSSGRMAVLFLDVSAERMEAVSKKEERTDSTLFVQRLNELGRDPLNFCELLKREAEREPEAVRDIILEAME